MPIPRGKDGIDTGRRASTPRNWPSRALQSTSEARGATHLGSWSISWERLGYLGGVRNVPRVARSHYYSGVHTRPARPFSATIRRKNMSLDKSLKHGIFDSPYRVTKLRFHRRQVSCRTSLSQHPTRQRSHLWREVSVGPTTWVQRCRLRRSGG